MNLKKYDFFHKRIKTFSNHILKSIDNINNKLNKILINSKSISQDLLITFRIRKLLFIFSEFRLESIKFFNLMQNNNNTSDMKKLFIFFNIHWDSLFYSINFKIIPIFIIDLNEYPIFLKPNSNLLITLLKKVPYDNEYFSGYYDYEIQNIFESLFIYRNKKIINSLQNLKFVFQTRSSFSNIEGFCKAIASTLVEEFKINIFIPQLVLCINRLIYPLIYQNNESFFLFSTQNIKEYLIKISFLIDENRFQKSIEKISEISFHLVPIDMLYILFLSSNLLIESFYIKNNEKTCGGDELHQLIELLIKKIKNPELYSILLWLEKYSNECEINSSLKYLLISFISCFNILKST